jgi:hypothetical protein
MGAVIAFPEGRRAMREMPARQAGTAATVVILPVIRIVRENEVPSVTIKSPPGRKRRRRASPP